LETGYLETSEGNVFFRKIGTGKRLFIALHGFGQDSTVFSRIPIPSDSCLYALDLPWHGLTKWENPDFYPNHLKNIIEAVLKREKGITQFDALGFSYGAGLWLGAMPYLDRICHRAFLVSPEAISGRWQRWTTGIPGNLRKRLGQIVQLNPSGFLKFAGLLEKIHLLHPFALRFLRHHLEDPAKRVRMLNTWVNLAHFPFSSIALTTAQAIPCDIHILIGEKDPLLNPPKIKKWAQGVPGLRLHLLPYGHHLLEKVDWAMLLG